MSPIRFHQRMHTTSNAAVSYGGGRGVRRLFGSLLFVLSFSLFVPRAFAGGNVNLQKDPNGVALTAISNDVSSASLGTMNALGIGTPATSVYVIPLSNGALYYTFVDVKFQKVTGGHTSYVTAYVSANFSHPAAFVLENCAYPSSCNTSGSYSAMSTNSAAQTGVVPSPGVAQGVTSKIGVGIFLPDNNGPSAFTGTDSVTIIYNAFDFQAATQIDTMTLTLDSNTLQDAVRLNLGTDASGLTVSTASDYSMNFGTVNALGIGPAAGLTTVAQAGGIIYSTPYDLLPTYTGFSSTSATIKVCVSTTFTHSTVLGLYTSTTGSVGSFTSISTNCGTATSLTSTAASRSTIVPYLGLFVSNVNGASSFRGTDTATLTFTLTVP